MNTCGSMYVCRSMHGHRYVPKRTCSCTSMGRVCYVSMGNLVSMSVDSDICTCDRCMCVCVDMYMCIYMFVSRKVIRAHIAFVCTL